MSRTHLKPGLRSGFGWCWYTQQLFNAPFGVVHVLEPRFHSENMGRECQKYHIVGNLVAVFKKFSHLGERWIRDDQIHSLIMVEKIASFFNLASSDIFDTVDFERPYECTSTSARLKYQIVLNIDHRQEMFDNPVCQIPRCLNIIVAPIWNKLFGYKVLSEPIVVFGIIVNIEIVEAFITSDRVAYFGYGDALSLCAPSPEFRQLLQMGSVAPPNRTCYSKEPLNRPTPNPKTFRIWSPVYELA
jgi:hypothetical protein